MATKYLSRLQQNQHFIRQQLTGRSYSIEPTILNIDTPIIPLDEAHRFIVDCLVSLNAPKEHADEQAKLLIAADYRGHYSHGMNRLGIYTSEIQAKICDPCAKATIVKENPACAWIDGKNGLGAVVSKFSMEVAIRKAKEIGVGWVAAKGGNHYGMAGYWTTMAVNEGLIGISCTNSSPLVVPTRAKKAALGTNPLSLAAPGLDGDNFILDMATSAVALGKLEIAARKKVPLLTGWALDENGQVTTDARKGLKAMLLMPLGGSEENSGYKGTGLGLLVEIFCGILAGANYGPNIRGFTKDFNKIANLGHCFIAVDIERFAPCFKERLSDLMNFIRKMESIDPSKPPLIHGDLEKAHMKSVDENGGVRYVENQHKTCNKLAKLLNVKPLQAQKI